jgi:hypothetical protein
LSERERALEETDMSKRADESATGRPRRRRRRKVDRLKQHFDAGLALERKLKTRTFVPIVTEVFLKLHSDDLVSGTYLARYCRSFYSSGSVWSHLNWLVDSKILVMLSDGQKAFFGLNPDMPEDARRLLDRLYLECNALLQARETVRRRRQRRR